MRVCLFSIAAESVCVCLRACLRLCVFVLVRVSV